MRRDLFFLAVFGLLVALDLSLASTTGTVASATQSFWNEAKSFVQGPGGALLALAAVGWGVYSFIRGSFIMGIASILGGIGLYQLPGVIDNVFTMTI